VRGALDTGNTIIIQGAKYRVTVPMGSFGEIIRRVNQNGPSQPGNTVAQPIG
jgi:hypothetical protein